MKGHGDNGNEQSMRQQMIGHPESKPKEKIYQKEKYLI
jgi:hypothetical protein